MYKVELSEAERRLILQALNGVFASGQVRGTVREVAQIVKLGLSVMGKLQAAGEVTAMQRNEQQP